MGMHMPIKFQVIPPEDDKIMILTNLPPVRIGDLIICPVFDEQIKMLFAHNIGFYLDLIGKMGLTAITRSIKN